MNLSCNRLATATEDCVRLNRVLVLWAASVICSAALPFQLSSPVTCLLMSSSAFAQLPESKSTLDATKHLQETNSKFFAIRVIDAQTKRAVPLVKLKTIHHVQYVTDNLGWVAIDDPDLLDHSVFFTIESPGYSFAKDGFGFSGTLLDCTPGKTRTLEVQRIQPAERMYRSTGVARYIHSQKLRLLFEEYPEVENPSIGCDSVLTATFGNQLVWFWGDTSQIQYPIGGSFHMSGATTPLPDSQGLIAGIGLDQMPPPFRHWVDGLGRSKPMAIMPSEGPTWLLSLATIRDQDQPMSESLLAPYVKIKSGLQSYRWGFAKWNPATESFEHLIDWDQSLELFPQSQAHTIEYAEFTEPATTYIAFCSPIPDVRVLAQSQAFIDPSRYEGYTCLKDGTQFADRKLDRDAKGRLLYRWRRGTRPLSEQQERQLVEEKLMTPAERLRRIIDIDSGKEVSLHNGSVAWNPKRNCWSMVFTQLNGEDSTLGNIYYAESTESAVGPWKKAKLVARHPNYSFYNPKLHPEFFQKNGLVLFFEGTYSHTFSGNSNPTPRYDYNQLTYRLDLENQSWLDDIAAD